MFRGVGSTNYPTENGGGYVIRDIVFKFSASMAQNAAICLNWVEGVGCKSFNGYDDDIPLGGNSIVEDVIVAESNSGGIDVGGNNNIFSRTGAVSNGQIGYLGSCNYCLITDGSMSYNNWKNYPLGFEAGGSKFTFMDGTTIKRVKAFSNNGPGIWLDIWNRNNVVEGCATHDNYVAGIFIEYNSYNNLIQHNFSTLTRFEEGDRAAGILQQTSYHNYYYHNSLFNNRIQGIYLAGSGGEPGYTGQESFVANNLMVGNGIKSIFGPSDQMENGVGREIQVQDICSLGYEGVRSNYMNGNVYYSHVGDPNYIQNSDLHRTYRSFPDEPVSTIDCSGSTPYVLSTNSLSEWQSVNQEGPQSYEVDYLTMQNSNVDVTDLSIQEYSPNPNWSSLQFGQSLSTASLPTCDTAINPDCQAHPYQYSGANPEAHYGAWLDSSPLDPLAHSAHAEVISENSHVFAGLPYPNPFTDEISVPVHLDHPSTIRVSLIDVLGREVTWSKSEATSGTTIAKLNGRALPPGLYVVKTEIHHGSVIFTHRVVLAH